MKTLVCRSDATAGFPLADECVQAVVTSPPYWGLRDYGVEGQLGLESTPEEYVEGMVGVFRDVWRVLRVDGTVWLNMGDCYVSSPRGNALGNFSTSTLTNPGRQDALPRPHGRTAQRKDRSSTSEQRSVYGRFPGLKAKDLVGVPWRLAFALQADGWYLRSDIVWSKPNPMPESVTDRPTKAHEYLFLLTKSARYFYDGDAVREPHVEPDRVQRRYGNGYSPTAEDGTLRASGIRVDPSTSVSPGYNPVGRNLRSVWTIATQPFPEAHFATFPTALVRPCILAGSRPNDLVIDPFAGSGTVGVVARQHGRRFIGLELNSTYATMAVNRIEREGRPKETRPLRDPSVMQGGLFE